MTIGDFYTLFRARPAPNILHLIQPKGKDNMPLRDTILKEIQSVAASQKKTVPPLTDGFGSIIRDSTRFASRSLCRVLRISPDGIRSARRRRAIPQDDRRVRRAL